ncbi:hypothetical protein OSB04_003862 [Centaurea solstitialis]|uniref:Myb/SANT-like DNA-binding domain-containing protein n=1 Tax=Centaurea solstitialis TaxID=347529 RepID=A0AA38U654_9ASTR|nr:hypothetical protein OSB04_003862 [Centaurea solstitialis]
MASETNKVCDNGVSTPIQMGVDDQPPPGAVAAVAGAMEVVDDKSKSPQDTRKVCENGGSNPIETGVVDQQPPGAVVAVVGAGAGELVAIRANRHDTRGKKVAENRGRRGRRSSSVFGSDQLEPKWDSVASYCRQHAVNRGPVQCRKRWSNMVGDFKKIKAWESQVKHESDSYWVMRNDSRKENKLPGFFDREVFDVLDGKAFTKAAYKLALVTISADAKDENVVAAVEEEEEEEDAEVVFDSGRRATSADGLFPVSEKMTEEEEEANDEGLEKGDSPAKTIADPMPISGTLREQHTNSVSWKGCMSQDGNKRRRVSTEECQDKSFDARLIEVLEKNNNVLSAHLEEENTNRRLDRDQRKDYNDNLVSALNKISDALTKIADKSDHHFPLFGGKTTGSKCQEVSGIPCPLIPGTRKAGIRCEKHDISLLENPRTISNPSSPCNR